MGRLCFETNNPKLKKIKKKKDDCTIFEPKASVKLVLLRARARGKLYTRREGMGEVFGRRNACAGKRFPI